MLRALFPMLAVVFLMIAVYDTFKIVDRDQRLSDRERIVAQSSVELAKLPNNERLLLILRAQQALEANPLDRGPLYNLAALAKAEGKSKQANELILLAADRSLRDPNVLAEA